MATDMQRAVVIQPYAPDGYVGTRIGELLLFARVAQGALAAVYRASDGGADFAVKIYDQHAAPPSGVRAELESAAQSKIQHPSVARLVGSGRLDDGSPYVVSEWIDGASLTQLIASRPSWPAVRHILRAIGAGLGAIHAAGVVHRDLKPGNVMVPATGTPAAVILDFSHALIVGSSRVTQTGVVLGSSAYMSPEQAAGLPLDGRSDLYALGVICYELLTGVPPFVDVSPAELLRRHQCEPVISPRRRAPDRHIPQAAEDLCMWLLVKNRDARMPNARVLAVTLGAMGDVPETGA
jgi:eukaryotic-like serine/threonine-protein kinase